MVPWNQKGFVYGIAWRTFCSNFIFKSVYNHMGGGGLSSTTTKFGNGYFDK